MFDKLDEVKQRYDEITSQLSDPEIASDPKQFTALAKEHSHLQDVVNTYSSFTRARKDLEENKLLFEDSDPDIREMAKEEVASLSEEIKTLELKLKSLLIPKDPLDDKNIFLEVRAGTGGDEAALFGADLYTMYRRYAESRGWKIGIVSISETDQKGIKEVVALIEGKDVYSSLKYEGGTHRVQRVPETETQGRVHTSAVTVAVLPEVGAVDVDIKNIELRIDTYRSSGAGGQHVNTTDSAIRITHLPSGLVVTCQDEKSQHKNKAKAMKVLQSRLFEMRQAEQNAIIAAERKEQVGSGDRSGKIRTYNYPQNRCTDHRINFTSYNLDGIMKGALNLVIEPLQTFYQAEALQALDNK